MSYRAIDITGFSPAVPQDQAMPILQWVDLDNLVIDTRYQRELGPRNRQAIQAIANGFDWMQFSPVLVAPAEGGRFAVIDGQHRVHAAAICGLTRVPAQIVMASAQQQARAFAGVNGAVTRITAHHVYRAALAAHEGWALRCRDVVEAAGCSLATFNPSSKAEKPQVIYQIGNVRQMIVDRGQADALGAVLRGIVAYDTTGRVPLYSDYILRPMVQALHGAPALARMDVAAFCAAFDPFKVLNRVAQLRADGQDISPVAAMRTAMLGFAGVR